MIVVYLAEKDRQKQLYDYLATTSLYLLKCMSTEGLSVGD
ncbi:hypothetical protein RV12_GL001393 [Enterococcus quebecensis]|nr:hypothetical protein RV12_GL001393 [Enterococcus quebecensis]